jgi:hypothetical protein
VQTSALKTEPVGRRADMPASRSKPWVKPRTDTGIKRAKKPPKPDGYSWRRDGSGFELRKAVYVETDTGIKKRKLPYVGRLSKSAFAEMKRRHKGAKLEQAISDWIAAHGRLSAAAAARRLSASADISADATAGSIW